MSEPFKTICLDNGMLLSFLDLSNRYYGDFHRVCVRVTASISLSRLNVPADLLPLKNSFPETLSWEKQLERMGVATAERDKVREALVNDFVSTAVSYLSRPGFPERLLRKKLAGKLRGFNLSSAGD